MTGRYYVEKRTADLAFPDQRQSPENEIELTDDEQILTSEFRGGNRVVCAVLVPTTAARCQGVTTSDEQCQRDAAEDSDYCKLHQDNE